MTLPDISPKPAGKQSGSIINELGPAIAFVLVYNILLRRTETEGFLGKDNALFAATGVLIAVTLAILVRLLLRGQRIPPMLILSSAIIGGFGTMGIVFQNKLFLFLKPTIINLGFSALIFGGLAMGRNFIRMLMGSALVMPDAAWRTLAIRWGLFFIAMAVWNEVLWRNFSEATWANWKLGNIGITFIFILANMPFLMKHMKDQPSESNSPE